MRYYTVYYKGKVSDTFSWDDAYDLALDIGPGCTIREHRADGTIVDRQRYEDLGVDA